ncbi:MAG TPA: helix-turn-helix domain-containing protein [Solirubrobacterales bacterium]|nr:helix-turn-helix domain-containing protein [Solirubrobacterales bacterium]
MEKRAASAEATRKRILDAARGLWLERWYDEMTLRELAVRAGVALQTVINHFGSKDGIAAAMLEEPLPEAWMTRATARPGEIGEAMELLVADYEITGDALIRSLALEGRIPALHPVLELGRRAHRAWVEHVFPAALTGLSGAARTRRLDLLVCAADLYTWKLLRRDRGLSQARTAEAMQELVEALHR